MIPPTGMEIAHNKQGYNQFHVKTVQKLRDDVPLKQNVFPCQFGVFL